MRVAPKFAVVQKDAQEWGVMQSHFAADPPLRSCV